MELIIKVFIWGMTIACTIGTITALAAPNVGFPWTGWVGRGVCAIGMIIGWVIIIKYLL